jgi:thioredoxin reductase (NADPH)
VAGGNAESFEAPAVIIATGVSKDEHFLAGERELVGRGVFYSALNEAPSLKHGTVVIVGKSEETAIAVLHLTKFADKIFFVIPGSKLDVSENLLRMLEAERKIEPLFSSSIKKINGEEELHSVTVLSAGTEREIKAKAAFIYTYPLKPCSQVLKDAVETDKESGRILVNPEFSTSRPGIFACGDVLAGELQHPSISTAQGIVAAISAEKLF